LYKSNPVRLTPALDGGCAHGIFGCTGLNAYRSANLRTAASLCLAAKRRWISACVEPNRAPHPQPRQNHDADNESLLADACETLGSATVMLNDQAGLVNGAQRKTLQGIAQIVMVAEMAVNRVLDRLVPTD
jgi:hypothetical protein